MTAILLIKPLNLFLNFFSFYFLRRCTCFLFFTHLLFSILRLLPLSTRVSFLYSCVGPTRRTLERVSLLHSVPCLFAVEVWVSFPTCSLDAAGKQIKGTEFLLHQFRYHRNASSSCINCHVIQESKFEAVHHSRPAHASYNVLITLT